MQEDYKTEFERAMRGCRRRVQERFERDVERARQAADQDQDTPEHSIGAQGE